MPDTRIRKVTRTYIGKPYIYPIHETRCDNCNTWVTTSAKRPLQASHGHDCWDPLLCHNPGTSNPSGQCHVDLLLAFDRLSPALQARAQERIDAANCHTSAA